MRSRKYKANEVDPNESSDVVQILLETDAGCEAKEGQLNEYTYQLSQDLIGSITNNDE